VLSVVPSQFHLATQWRAKVCVEAFLAHRPEAEPATPIVYETPTSEFADATVQ